MTGVRLPREMSKLAACAGRDIGFTFKVGIFDPASALRALFLPLLDAFLAFDLPSFPAFARSANAARAANCAADGAFFALVFFAFAAFFAMPDHYNPTTILQSEST